MRARSLVASGLALLLMTGPLAITARAASLSARLGSIISHEAPPGSLVGVSVVDAGTGRVLYAHDAQRLLMPASLNKLLTASASLTLLGPQKRFFTRVFGEGTLQGGILKGSLYLRGGGDPSLEIIDLKHFAEQLRAQGIQRVQGSLVADDTLFKPESRAPGGWLWDDLEWDYGAPASALTLHHNAVDLIVSAGARSGAPIHVALSPATRFVQLTNEAVTQPEAIAEPLDIELGGESPQSGQLDWRIKGGYPSSWPPEMLSRSIPDPARYAGTLFKEVLGDSGIAVEGPVLVEATPRSARLLASHASAPLAELVKHMDKESDNLFAETLLLQLGLVGQKSPATRLKGLLTVQLFLSGLGIRPNSYQVVDGCGLSRYDFLSPALLTTLLAAMHKKKGFGALKASLPIAGTDGTLAGRLEGPGIRGRLHAKTGTMTGVSGLAGYLDTGKRTLAFAVMVEGYVGKPGQARVVQDALVKALAASGGY